MQVSATNGEAAHTARHADVEQAIVGWLRTELDDPEITGSDNFLDVGGHSLTFSKMNKILGDSFGVALDQKTTYEETLSAAVAAMRPAGGSEVTVR
jgi:Phosphopantetheine attachment site